MSADPPPRLVRSAAPIISFAILGAGAGLLFLLLANPVLQTGGHGNALAFLLACSVAAWLVFYVVLETAARRRGRVPSERWTRSGLYAVSGAGFLLWSIVAGVALDPTVELIAGIVAPGFSWAPIVLGALAGLPIWGAVLLLLRVLPRFVRQLPDRRWPVVLALGAALIALGLTVLGSARRDPAAAIGPLADGAPDWRVVLFGIDGADWRVIEPLIAAGELPNLRRLRSEGASGPLATLKSFKSTSPVIWATLATSRPPEDHGVVWFYEYFQPSLGVRIPKLDFNPFERLQLLAFARRPTPFSEWRAKPVWEVLSELGRSVLVVNWWFTDPPAPVNGVVISDNSDDLTYLDCDLDEPPADMGFGAPAHHPPDLRLQDLPGGCDLAFELGERVEDFLDGRDLETVRREVAEVRIDPLAAEQLNTMDSVLEVNQVREDIHLSAFQHLLGSGQFDFAAYLGTRVDQNSHHYTKRVFGAAKGGGFEPIVPETVRLELWEKAVVSAYRMMDTALGQILAGADDHTLIAVVSDHGWEYDGTEHQSWPPGIVVLWGPPVRPGASIEGASIHDVAPTLLWLLGSPLSERLTGEPLMSAFREDVALPAVRYVPSYGPPEGRAAADFDADEANTHIERLKALGYIR